MSLVFFDTHAHLDFPDYADDLEEAIGRALDAGVSRVVAVGIDARSSAKVVALSEQFSSVYAAVGWHPSHAMEAPDDVRHVLRQLASHHKVVAIGEAGLDYYRLPSKQGGSVADDERIRQKQLALFQQQLEVASELGLNCVVHQRDAFEDVASLLRPHVGKVRAVFHCFVNDTETLLRVVGMGSVVSFTGIITFKNAQAVRQTLADAPLGRFMLETDCPYLAPSPHRGKRCEPAHVIETAAVAARVKGVSLEELSNATCATARGFFGKIE